MKTPLASLGLPRVRRAGDARYDAFVGVGGIGWAQVFALDGNETVGRNESRDAQLLDVRDYCKLHIVLHMLAVLTSSEPEYKPRIIPIGVVGSDGPGRRLLRQMQSAGMDTSHVSVTLDRSTTYGVAFQYPDASTFYVTSSNGAAATLSHDQLATAISAVRSSCVNIAAIAVPEIPLSTRIEFLEAFAGVRCLRVASFTGQEMPIAASHGYLSQVDLLALNESEATSLIRANKTASPIEEILDKVRERLVGANPNMKIVLTAGANGAFAFDGETWDHCPAPVVPVVNAAGAGDAFLSGVLAGLWAGFPLSDPSRTGVPLANRGLATALDVGVFAAAHKLGFADTIPSEATPLSISLFARRLGLDPSILLPQAGSKGWSDADGTTLRHGVATPLTVPETTRPATLDQEGCRTARDRL